MKRTLSILLLSLIFLGCEKEETKDQPKATGAGSVIIGNEGNFPDGISSISLYRPEHEEVQQNLYQTTNGSAIGSTVNDILVDGERIFFVVNGTGSVVVTDTAFQLLRVFQNLPNVRKIIKVGEERYFVSSWDLGGLYVLDMATESITDTILTGTGPSAMLRHGEYIFVANSGAYTSDSTVSVINVQSESLIGEFIVGENPNSLQIDADNNLWVLSSGIPDYSFPENSTKGSLLSFSLDSLTQKLDLGGTILPQGELYFENNEWQPTSLLVNESGDRLYFLHDGVEADIYSMAVNSTELPTEPLISGSFYAMGYDAARDEIYASDPLSYTQSGKVSRFSAASGERIDEFSAGIIPGCFAFR